MTKKLTPLRFGDLLAHFSDEMPNGDNTECIAIEDYLAETNEEAYTLVESYVLDKGKNFGVILDVQDHLYTGEPEYRILWFGHRGSWWSNGVDCRLVLKVDANE